MPETRPRPEQEVEVHEVSTDPETGERYVRLEPYWPNLVRKFAHDFTFHNFEEGKFSPIVSFMEMVGHMAQTNSVELHNIIEEFKRKPQ